MYNDFKKNMICTSTSHLFLKKVLLALLLFKKTFSCTSLMLSNYTYCYLSLQEKSYLETNI